MNIYVSKNDTCARKIATKVQQVKKCIIKNCISEFVCLFSVGRGPVNTFKMQRVGRQSQTDTGGFEGRMMEREQVGGSQTLGEWRECHCIRFLCHLHGMGAGRSRQSNPQAPGLNTSLRRLTRSKRDCPLACLK